MTTQQTIKKRASGDGTGSPAANVEGRQTLQGDYTPLRWFDKQGARFVKVAAWNAKVKSPGKGCIESGWQNKPYTFDEILPHLKSGGNVGMICGKHSSGLIFVDIDENLPGFLATFPQYADTPRVVRDDPNKAKFILRLTPGTEYESKKKFKRTPQDKHPFLEVLATDNQGVIPPSRHPSGELYRLENSDKPIPIVTVDQLTADVNKWNEIMRSPAPTADTPHEPKPRKITSQEFDDTLRDRVRHAWTPLQVFEHFGMAGNGTRKEGAWIRVFGNGGLFVHENSLTWAMTSNGNGWGGDVFDAWHFASTQGESPKLPSGRFYKTLRAMAEAAGVSIEQKAKRSTNNALALVADDGEQSSSSHDDGRSVKRYDIINGAFHALEYKEIRGADPVEITRPLCNFTARIIEEIAKDDGQAITRQLKLKGRLATGQSLPEIEVSADEYKGMNWIMQKWGVSAIIHAGQANAEKVREAIQWQEVSSRKSRIEYTHTGWREIQGKRVYLTSAGALGAENVVVSLDGNLRRYALPVSLDEINMQEAVAKSLQLLDLAPRSVTWALWGSMYLAPLADLEPLDFALWVFGETGSLKSTLAALFLSHYGNFSYKTLPEGWASTDNALEKSIFTIKDAPIVIDDFAPQASGMEAQNYEKRAARIIRAIGNHSPRTRMNADTTLREGYPSRGLVISTAEQLPSGQSILARILPVEVLRESVNKDLLTRAQRDAGYLSQAMAGYIAWLADKWEAIRKDHKERIVKFRDEMRGDYHLRTPEMFAHLLLGIQLGLTYATEAGAITKADAVAMLKNAKDEIRNLAESQSEHVRDELPSQRFINTLEALISRGDFYLTDQAGTGESIGKTWLGWFDDDFVYIQSESAYNAVSEFLRREGSPPLLKPKSLYSMIERMGFIMPRNTKGNNVAYYRNKPFRVLCFYRNKVNFLCEKVSPPSGKV